MKYVLQDRKDKFYVTGILGREITLHLSSAHVFKTKTLAEKFCHYHNWATYYSLREVTHIELFKAKLAHI